MVIRLTKDTRVRVLFIIAATMLILIGCSQGINRDPMIADDLSTPESTIATSYRAIMTLDLQLFKSTYSHAEWANIDQLKKESEELLDYQIVEVHTYKEADKHVQVGDVYIKVMERRRRLGSEVLIIMNYILRKAGDRWHIIESNASDPTEAIEIPLDTPMRIPFLPRGDMGEMGPK